MASIGSATSMSARSLGPRRTRGSWLTVTSTIAAVLLLVTACTGGVNNPSPSGSSSSASATTSPGSLPDTFPLPAGRIADAEVLPKGVTPDDPSSSDQVAQKVQTILATARSDENHRLTGVLQLLHASGISVADAGQGNKVLQEPASPTIGTVDVTQIEGLDASADSPVPTSVKAVLNAISTSTGLPQIPSQGFIEALRQDLAAADSSSDLTRRFWAELIYTAGPAGAQLRQSGSAAPDDVSLVPLQAMLIFNQMTGEAAQKLKSGASSHALAAPNMQLAEGGGSTGCNPQEEAAKLTTEIFKTTYGKVVEKALEYTLEALGPKVEDIADLVEVLMPVINTLAAKGFVRVDMSQTADPVARTRSANMDGDTTHFYAHFHFEVPAGNILACVALYLFLISLGKVDPNVPASGDIGDMPFTWSLHDAGVSKAEPRGFIRYADGQSNKILQDSTDAHGNASIDIEGTAQNRQKPDTTGAYIRNAKMSVQYNPNANTKTNMASVLSKGVAAAIAANASPPGATVRFGVEIMISIGFFTATGRINVKDWVLWPREVDVNLQGGYVIKDSKGKESSRTSGTVQATWNLAYCVNGTTNSSPDQATACGYSPSQVTVSWSDSAPPPYGGPLVTVANFQGGQILSLCLPGGSLCTQSSCYGGDSTTMVGRFGAEVANSLRNPYQVEFDSSSWTPGITVSSFDLPGDTYPLGAEGCTGAGLYGHADLTFKY